MRFDMKLIRFAACLFACVVLWSSARPALAFTAKDVETLSSAYTSAFYTLSDGTNGYFKDTQTGGNAYFWGQAEMIECVIDAYEWNGNPTHGAMITNLLNGFIKQNGSAWNWNIYNDNTYCITLHCLQHVGRTK